MSVEAYKVAKSLFPLTQMRVSFIILTVLPWYPINQGAFAGGEGTVFLIKTAGLAVGYPALRESKIRKIWASVQQTQRISHKTWCKPNIKDIGRHTPHSA